MKTRISEHQNRGHLNSPPQGIEELEKKSFIATFYAFFLLEWNRFIRPRNMIIWLCSLLLITAFVNKGVNQYKAIPGKIQKFNQIQENYLKSIKNYKQYAWYGVRMLFFPSPCGILFQNTTIPGDALAKVDSIVTVQMVNNLKGKAAASGMDNGKIDFSRIVIWLFNLFALWYGYESLQTRDFILSSSGPGSRFRVFFSIVASRFILFAGAYACMSGCVLLWVKARGIQLSSTDYKALCGYLLVTLIMLLFFFICGVIYGTFRSTAISFACILGTLIILVFLVPGLIGEIAGKNFPDAIEDYKTEMEKIKNIDDFEKTSAEKHGQFDRGDIEKEQNLIEMYRDNYFNRVVKQEERLMKQMQRAMHRANKLAILFPTTFFLLTGNEVSGKGYAGYMEFYDYVKKMWFDFAMFWIDRVFYHDHKVMVYFLKGDENIFRSKSRLPENFKTGMVLQTIVIIILFFIAYIRFKKWLHPAPKKAGAFAAAAIDFNKGKQYTIKVDHIDFSRQLLNRFYGQYKGLKWKLTIDNKDVQDILKQEFFYIPNAAQIPGEIKVKDLLMLYKRLFKPPDPVTIETINAIDKKMMNSRFRQLDNYNKAVILLILSRLTGAKVYIFIDFAAGVPGSLRNGLYDYAAKLGTKDCILIDMVSTDCYWLDTHEFITVAYRHGKYEIKKA
jgi:hypothetical protein